MEAVVIKDLSEKELLTIGEMILNIVNINLFNAEPTIHKAYQIYFELAQYGYVEEDKERACERIKQFFMKRTLKNQHKEFYAFFGFPYSSDMNGFLTLSYRTSEIPLDRISEVAAKVKRVLAPLDLTNEYGIDEGVIVSALIELYNPKYHESEWKISIPAIANKIKKRMSLNGKGHNTEAVNYVFSMMEDNPQLRKTSNLYLVKDEKEGPASVVNGNDEINKTKSNGFKEADKSEGFITDAILAKDIIIKDSELTYVKGVLEILDREEIPSSLDVDLYQSDQRHPLITNFLNLAKSYNRLMGSEEDSIREVIADLKVVVRSLKESGEEVERRYDEKLGHQLKRVC